MAKRALLIGCNYPGSANPLNGCVNDVRAMQALITEHYGFDPANVTVMIDTDPSGEQPTGAAIKRRLREHVAATAPGDVLLVHYSGHGTQVPDRNRDEGDRRDEALVPSDHNCITDDDLRDIFRALPDGASLTFVADCCHSGTLLDQPEVQISGPKSDDPAAPATLPDTFSANFGGAADNREARSLPPEALAAALARRLGVDVAPDQLRGALVAAFGADATAKLAPLVQKLNEAVEAAGGVEALANKAAAAVDGLIPGAGGVANDLLGAAGGLLGSLAGGGGGGGGGGDGSSASRGFGSALFGLALELLSAPEMAAALPPAGAKPSAAEQLPPGKALLISGCMASETSADACPSGDPSRAFGALTNALTTTLRTFKQQYPEHNLSARSLVSHVREQLLRQRFGQNPCLESDAAKADAGFIIG